MCIKLFSTVQLAQSFPACTRATCINNFSSYRRLQLQQLSYYTLLIPSQFNSVCFFLFCFVIAYLHCCISASHPEVRLSRWPSVRVSLTFCLHWPCGMLCQFSLCHQAVGCLNSPAVCIARVPLLPSVGTWSLVHHGFYTSWTVFKTYYLTCFLLALVAPFSRGCVSVLLGGYVPSFPQGFF